MQTALRKKTETGNEKDPSAALGMTKRGNASFHSFSTCCGSQPRLAALGSPFQGKGLAWTLPPSYGRRCPEGAEVGWGWRYERERGNASQVDDIREHPIHRCAVPLPQGGRLRYEDAAFPILSFRAKARNLFRSRSGKGCEDSGEREAPCSQRIGRTVFHADSITKENGNGKRKRSLGCARDDETRERLFPFLFNLLRKPTPPRCARQPLPREGACVVPFSFQRKGGRIPLSPYCHFERKREIFFVRGQAKDVRIAASGKHRASSESEGRCFMQTALRKKTETGNEKDPSAALGMTKRGNASFHSFSTCCESQPRLAALGSPFQGKGLAWTLPPSYGRRCPEGAEVGWGKCYLRHKAFPVWGRWRAERAG